MTARPSSSEKPPLPSGCGWFEFLAGGAQVLVLGCVVANALWIFAPSFRSEGILIVMLLALVPLHFAAGAVHLQLARRMSRQRALWTILKASPLWLRLLTYGGFLWFAIAVWRLKAGAIGTGSRLFDALPTCAGFAAWMAVLDWRIFWWRLRNLPAAGCETKF